MPPPIVLVPGWWLGAWAWDEVAVDLREAGNDVTALTLPGLESADTDRSRVSLEDHVGAIVRVVEDASAPAVLAVHSGAGAPGYAATDRVPERIAAMIYVDSGPAIGALDPSFVSVEKPLPPTWEELDENLDGLSDEQLETFRARAVPEPGGPIRDAVELTNDARLDVPTTVICSAFPSDQVKEAVKRGYPWIGGLAELRNVNYVDLRTSHWPMWSRPHDVASVIGSVAQNAAS